MLSPAPHSFPRTSQQPLGKRLLRAFFANCLFITIASLSGTQALGQAETIDEVFQLISELGSKIKSNREKIIIWQGVATFRKREGDFEVRFGINRATHDAWFNTQATTQAGIDVKDQGLLTVAQVHTGGQIYCYESGRQPEKVIRITPRISQKNQVSEVDFNPLGLLSVMGESGEVFLNELLDCRSREWFSITSCRERNIVSVSFANDRINVAPTQLFFDLELGGNLIKCINPGPGFVIETEISYECAGGVYLPASWHRLARSGEEIVEDTTIEIVNHNVNQMLNQDELDVLHLLGVSNQDVIVRNEIEGQVFSLISASEQNRGSSWISFRFTPIRIFASFFGLLIAIFAMLAWNRTPHFPTKTSLKFALIGGVGIVSFASIQLLSSRTAMPTADSQSCGSHCVEKILRMSGINVPDAELGSHIPRRLKGNSLEELRVTLGRFGFEASVSTPKSVLDIEEDFDYAIASLSNPDHYILIVKGPDGQKFLFDGIAARQSIETDELLGRWKGVVLNVYKPSEKNSRAVKGDIVFDQLYKEVGRVDPEKPLNVDFKFRVSGEKTVKIIAVHRDCDCLAVEHPQQGMLPGETGNVRMIFSAKKNVGVDGQFCHTVVVEFDNGEIAKLELGGRFDTSVYFLRKHIDFGAVSSIDECSAEVPIRFAANFEPSEDLPVIRLSKGLFSFIEWAEVNPSRRVASVRIGIKLPRQTDRHEELRDIIEIVSRDGASIAQLPISVTLQPNAILFPELVVVDRERALANFVVFCPNYEIVSAIGTSDSKLEKVKVTVARMQSPGFYDVTVSLECATPGFGEMYITFSDETGWFTVSKLAIFVE